MEREQAEKDMGYVRQQLSSSPCFCAMAKHPPCCYCWWLDKFRTIDDMDLGPDAPPLAAQAAVALRRYNDERS